MAWAEGNRASGNTRRPLAICDRCGQRRVRPRLNWQYEWQGTNLINLRLLVCHECLDVPQMQFRQYPLPPDPIPVLDPRPDVNAGVVLGVDMLTEGGMVIYPDGGSLAPAAVLKTDELTSGPTPTEPFTVVPTPTEATLDHFILGTDTLSP